ncbi:unnamed protein product [Sphagnum tenellum]
MRPGNSESTVIWRSVYESPEDDVGKWYKLRVTCRSECGAPSSQANGGAVCMFALAHAPHASSFRPMSDYNYHWLISGPRDRSYPLASPGAFFRGHHHAKAFHPGAPTRETRVWGGNPQQDSTSGMGRNPSA